MAEAFTLVTGPEVAIRMWATQDDLARQTVAQVDAVRRRFVLAVFRCLVVDDEQAELMANIFSTMLIGSMTILPRVPPARVLAWSHPRRRPADAPYCGSGAAANHHAKPK